MMQQLAHCCTYIAQQKQQCQTRIVFAWNQYCIQIDPSPEDYLWDDSDCNGTATQQEHSAMHQVKFVQILNGL